MIATCTLVAALLIGDAAGGHAHPVPVVTATPPSIDQVAIETGKLVSVTHLLVWATFGAALAAVAAPFLVEVAQLIPARKRAEAARIQLLVFLKAHEAASMRLVAAPEASIAPQAQALLPLFARALALDVALAIPRERRSDVYAALAVAQQTLVEANVRQEELRREVAALDVLHKDADELVAVGRQFSETIRAMQLQLDGAPKHVDPKPLEDSLRGLKEKQTAHNASPAYTGAQEFLFAERGRRDAIAAAWRQIGGKAADAQRRLQVARAALGDISTVDAPAGAEAGSAAGETTPVAGAPESPACLVGHEGGGASDERPVSPTP